LHLIDFLLNLLQPPNKIMRKALFAIGLVAVLALAGLLLLLPRQITLTPSLPVRAPANTVVRCLTERDKWVQWWPAAHRELQYPEALLDGGLQMNNSVVVGVPVEDSMVSSLLIAIGVAHDSTLVSWTASLQAATNPLQRVRTWLAARKLKAELLGVLHRLKDFAEDPQKVYGISIKEIKVKHPYLVAIKETHSSYPSTNTVYAQVEILKTYINSAGAQQTGAPMLHVLPRDSGRYEFMVALPVNRLLPDQGPIKQKQMVLGNILEAEVRGGDAAARQGLAALEDYMKDHGYRSPAIPYASLTTDRSKEGDTARWITHLYYPVF
jgi:hypothetical protein